MKAKIFLVAVLISLTVTGSSHAFGLLQYIFDAVSNQLGLDRGPIPKVVPYSPPPPYGPKQFPVNQHPDVGRIHIQAEGF
jgi:hypothetical protein